MLKPKVINDFKPHGRQILDLHPDSNNSCDSKVVQEFIKIHRNV